MLEYLKCKNDPILLYGFDAVLRRHVTKSVTVRKTAWASVCGIINHCVYMPKLRYKRQLDSVQQPVYCCHTTYYSGRMIHDHLRESTIQVRGEYEC